MLFSNVTRRGLIAAASAFAFAVSVPAFAEQKTQAERRAAQELFYNPADEPPSMDPTKQADSVSATWLGHIFEGLMAYDKGNNIVTGTADKMAVSADGKTYTFTIRKNAKWHDGKPVTAHDFEFAFKRLVDPTYASEYAFIAETAQIVNASEIIAKKADKETLGAKALNDTTFEIKLNNPVAFFPSMMAFNTFYPIRKDLVAKHGDKFATNVESLVGNGPFKLVKWQKESSMRLEKAANYWNAKAIKLNAIEAPVIIKDNNAQYNLYRTGGLDVAGLDVERLKIATKDKQPIKSFAEGTIFFLETNLREGKVFSNKKLRQALLLGINRNEYVNKISAIPGDKAPFGVVPDFMPGSKPGSTYRKEAPLAWKDGDVAGAKALIKEYLAETKQAKVPPFTILAGDTSAAKKDVDYFQATLAKIFETEVNVESVPFKTRIQRMRDAQFDLVVAGWGPDYMDAMTYLDLFLKENGNNHSGFDNAKYGEIIGKAQKSGDMAERVKLFQEAEKILVEEVPMVPFYQRARAYMTANGLQGVRRSQIGMDYDFRFASWSKDSAQKK